MRAFSTMLVIPAAGLVSVDGEQYQCGGVTAADVVGFKRTVPADRIIAIRWERVHGLVEGFGAMETFHDRSHVERYVCPWLRARAKAKRDTVLALARKLDRETATLAHMEIVMDSMSKDISEYEKNGTTAHMARHTLERTVGEHAALMKRMTTPRQINDAEVEATEAERELEETCPKQQ